VAATAMPVPPSVTSVATIANSLSGDRTAACSTILRLPGRWAGHPAMPGRAVFDDQFSTVSCC
jgi:hypothetical protein